MAEVSFPNELNRLFAGAAVVAAGAIPPMRDASEGAEEEPAGAASAGLGAKGEGVELGRPNENTGGAGGCIAAGTVVVVELVAGVPHANVDF